MSNINDYLKWRGDIQISRECPFNEIDSMILARFSYLLFERIDMEEKETIGSISEKMREFPNEEFRYNGDKELITNLGLSKRFRNMEVTNFVQNNEKENEKQFGAITVHINKNEIYISYIGTDSTIFGWKEDFNMAFMDNVPCQVEGRKYLIKIANRYRFTRIRIGGHSKGGNVAIYSAITVDRGIQDRIIKVYNYDGPGFNKKFIKKYGESKITEKIETYFPQESIIGRIMNHEEKYSVVLSIQKGILQHDIYSWEVLGTNPIYTASLTKTSEIISKTVTDWLENSTQEQRKIFFDSVFNILYSTEANTFGEISKDLTKKMPIILREYGMLSTEDKTIITKMTRLFIKNYFTELLNNNKFRNGNSLKID